MFEQLGSFQQAFDRSPDTAATQPVMPLRVRKNLSQRLVFWAANLVIMPVVGAVYAIVVADGMRVTLPVFQLRISKLPIPGIGIASQYDGWDRIDLAIIVSLLLFVVVAWLWTRVFTELNGQGTLMQQRDRSPIAFYMVSAVTAVMILGDAFLFYTGISAQTSSGWTETPAYVAPAVSLGYACGLMLIGWWHFDYRNSTNV